MLLSCGTNYWVVANIYVRAAVSCSATGPRLDGAGLMSGATGKLGRAWVGTWVGAWVGAWVHGGGNVVVMW